MAIKIGNNSIGKIFVGSNDISKIFLGNNSIYSESQPITTGLCFTSAQANSNVGYSITGTVDTSGIQYSTNGSNWVSWNGSDITLASVGDKIYVRNTKNTLSTGYSNCFRFTMSGLVNASGNVMSMLNYASLSDYCLCTLFRGCASLKTAPTLPATTLATGCYTAMFDSCSSLTLPPSLPAENLASDCYFCMFWNCTSLTTLPNLPAHYLYNRCYTSMFYGCTSLYVSTSSSSTLTIITIPQIVSGGFTSETMTFTDVFTNCLGTRTTNSLVCTQNSFNNLYVRNQPI